MGGPSLTGFDLPQQVQVVKETSSWAIPIIVASITGFFGIIGIVVKALLNRRKNK